VKSLDPDGGVVPIIPIPGAPTPGRGRWIREIGNEQAMGEIGPHEGRELELMLSGKKPMAMFTELWPLESQIPEEEFEKYVESGKIVKREVFELGPRLPGHPEETKIRRVLYSLPTEIWRIDAMIMLSEVYQRQRGWDAGLERMIGSLLGYEAEDIEAFVQKMGL
jgi:hypothetical protein